MSDVQRVRRELNLLLDVVIGEIRTSDEHEDEIRYESAPAFVALDRLERKAAAYDRARAQVKIEGATRAEYVLHAQAAKERVAELEDAIQEAMLPKNVARFEQQILGRVMSTRI